jgi:alcohol dehydrogenase
MANWKFFNSTEIVFGAQIPSGLGTHLEKKTTLFLTTPGWTKRGMTEKICRFLSDSHISFRSLDIGTPNPNFEDLKNISNELKDFSPEQIISLGGGSILDLGKILSYFLAKDAPSYDELILKLRNNQALPTVTPITFIAIPTTSGTGSEVTPFATIWDMENKKKYSIAAKNLNPTKAILSPELTLSLPWEITLSTGLDALSQCLESIWNKNFTPLSGTLAERGVRLLLRSLPVLKNDPANLLARSEVMEGSLLSGLCISQTRTAMAHSISYPLTAHYGTPHGIACSFTLPDLWDFNLKSDDGRMKNFSLSLGIKPEKFSQIILDFLTNLEFGKEFGKTISDANSVTKLSLEMFNPGRSDNNLESFNQETLGKFLDISTHRWI